MKCDFIFDLNFILSENVLFQKICSGNQFSSSYDTSLRVFFGQKTESNLSFGVFLLNIVPNSDLYEKHYFPNIYIFCRIEFDNIESNSY